MAEPTPEDTNFKVPLCDLKYNPEAASKAHKKGVEQNIRDIKRLTDQLIDYITIGYSENQRPDLKFSLTPVEGSTKIGKYSLWVDGYYERRIERYIVTKQAVDNLAALAEFVQEFDEMHTEIVSDFIREMSIEKPQKYFKTK